MTNKLNISLIALSTVLLGSMASCNDNDNNVDDNNLVIESVMDNCYAVVTDTQSPSAATVSNPVTLKFVTDWTDAKLDLSISGLKIGASTMPVLNLSNMPLTQDKDKWLVCEMNRVETESGSLTSRYTLGHFDLKYLDRFDLMEAQKEYMPACAFEFVIDDRYTVKGAKQPFVMTGVSKSTPVGGETFTFKNSMYKVALDFAKMTAKLTITKAKFLDGMPTLDMEFPDIPFVFADGGSKIILEKDAVAPTSGGRPGFPVSDFHAEIDTDEGMDMTFDCTYTDRTGKSTLYKVVIELDFTSYASVISE